MNVHVYDIFLYGRVFIYVLYIWCIYTFMCAFLYVTIVRNFLNIYLLYSNYYSLLSLIHIFSEFSSFLIRCLQTWRVMRILICWVLLRISICVFFIVQLQNVYPAGTVALCWSIVGPPSTTLDRRLDQRGAGVLWLLGSDMSQKYLHIQLLYTDSRVALAWAVFINLSESLPSNVFCYNKRYSSSIQHVFGNVS